MDLSQSSKGTTQCKLDGMEVGVPMPGKTELCIPPWTPKE